MTHERRQGCLGIRSRTTILEAIMKQFECVLLGLIDRMIFSVHPWIFIVCSIQLMKFVIDLMMSLRSNPWPF